MEQKRKYILIIACLVICCLVCTVFFLFYIADNTSVKTVYIDNAVDMYAQAAEIYTSSNLQLTITENTKTTIYNTTYTKASNTLIHINSTPPDRHRYHIQRELNMGTHHIAYEDYYIDGDHYSILSGIPFRRSANGSDETVFKAIPAPMLDPKLYTQIIGIKTDHGYRIDFSEATSVEKWVCAESVKPAFATGTATLSTDGKLLSCSYAATFEYDSIHYEVNYQLTAETTNSEISLPELDWVSINNSSAPLLLEQSVGFLVQGNPIHSTYQEEIYFEALGDKRTRNISIWLDNASPLSAQVVTETTTANDSRLGQSELTTKHEKFTDGKYTVTKDGAAEIADTGIDSEAMTLYLYNQLVSTIMLPQFIDDCTVESVDGSLRYHFSGNNAFAEFLCRNAGQQLYQDPNLLIDNAATIETEYLTCYLELDGRTMLPIASGISYKASYQNEGLPYHLSYEANQTYTYNQ